MKSLLTKKVSMTQVFHDNGTVEAVTVLVAPETFAEDVLKEGDEVAVTGTSKGKGFQGVVKRHKFKGGPRTHGQKHSEREPGSIGGGGRAGGRVAKGLRMAGRMGGETTTVRNLKVVKIFPESKEILISGAIPGRRGSAVIIKTK
jgi:large subunit ribosomal protein L3